MPTDGFVNYSYYMTIHSTICLGTSDVSIFRILSPLTPDFLEKHLLLWCLEDVHHLSSILSMKQKGAWQDPGCLNFLMSTVTYSSSFNLVTTLIYLSRNPLFNSLQNRKLHLLSVWGMTTQLCTVKERGSVALQTDFQPVPPGFTLVISSPPQVFVLQSL